MRTMLSAGCIGCNHAVGRSTAPSIATVGEAQKSSSCCTSTAMQGASRRQQSSPAKSEGSSRLTRPEQAQRIVPMPPLTPSSSTATQIVSTFCIMVAILATVQIYTFLPITATHLSLFSTAPLHGQAQPTRRERNPCHCSVQQLQTVTRARSAPLLRHSASFFCAPIAEKSVPLQSHSPLMAKRFAPA